ncbi:hypothetical protein BGZ61DRAFT_557184 [Ilyonectria robusta]|uniref:uncharacterized protein n=1 Tax=Ilyonectria robusta TaxID=1079257 RepID=UPI001E8E6828|nr:uncharacterized protein BGZ61DRAFT_557184 [Ilyonectria robusta]KAH8669866.1 hypothetical protein BGZ61DRAFT_557184 [Ilyonectria robusta]
MPPPPLLTAFSKTLGLFRKLVRDAYRDAYGTGFPSITKVARRRVETASCWVATLIRENAADSNLNGVDVIPRSAAYVWRLGSGLVLTRCLGLAQDDLEQCHDVSPVLSVGGMQRPIGRLATSVTEAAVVVRTAQGLFRRAATGAPNTQCLSASLACGWSFLARFGSPAWELASPHPGASKADRTGMSSPPKHAGSVGLRRDQTTTLQPSACAQLHATYHGSIRRRIMGRGFRPVGLGP